MLAQAMVANQPYVNQKTFYQGPGVATTPPGLHRNQQRNNANHPGNNQHFQQQQNLDEDLILPNTFYQ